MEGRWLYSVVLLVTLAICPPLEAFLVHKRSADNTLSDHLTDALKVIQRHKRRAIYDDVIRKPWNEDDYYDDWEGGSFPSSYHNFNRYEVPNLGDLFASNKYDSNDGVDPYDEPYFDLNEHESDNLDIPWEEDQEGNEVSNDELEDIFATKDKRDGEKVMLTEALLGPAGKRSDDKRLFDPTKDKKDAEFTGMKLSDLSPEDMNVLLQDAEATDDDDVSDSQDTLEDPLEDNMFVSAEEMGNIFSDSDSDSVDSEEADNVAMDVGTNELADVSNDEHGVPTITPAINKEWPVSQYLDDVQDDDEDSTVITKKKKRSGESTMYDSLGSDSGWSRLEKRETNQDLAIELAIAREDIKILKTYLQIEDDENAHLAHALNLATKSQTERTDKYVSEEISHIKQAIQDELDTQEVKDVLKSVASLPGMNDDMDSEDGNEIITPSDVQQFLQATNREEELAADDEVDIPDDDYLVDDDLENDVANEPSQDMTDIRDGDLIRALLAAKLEGMTDQSRDELPASYNTQFEDDTDQDLYLNPFLREILEKYKQSQYVDKRGFPPQGELKPKREESELPLDLDTLQQILEATAMEQAQDTDMCPAVDDLSTYCSFMSGLGMELDQEALELCNRHEICYTCGSELDLSADDCDRGYLQEAARLCADKDGCDTDASRLFIIMLRYHSYQQSGAPQQCLDSCLETYISSPVQDK